MKSARLWVLAALIGFLVIPLSGCKWLDDLVANYMKNYADLIPDDKVSGDYDAPWTVSEDTCNPQDVGNQGVSHVQIHQFDAARNAAVVVDGWMYLPEAEVHDTTVSGTAEGIMADDGGCDYRYTARIELVIDAKTKEITGTIDMSYAHQPACAKQGDASCENVKTF